jgi:DNA-binding Lrp family transcriptional regulator
MFGIVFYYKNFHTIHGEKKMVTAFVLINAETGAEEEIIAALKKMSGVKEVYFVYGVYDIVTRIESDTMKELKEVTIKNIRKMDKVRSTLTMIAME